MIRMETEFTKPQSGKMQDSLQEAPDLQMPKVQTSKSNRENYGPWWRWVAHARGAL